MKVLMGVDHSELSADLVQVMVKQLRPENTEILVLHILQQVTQEIPEMASAYAPEMRGERKSADSLVEGIAAKLRSAGFKAEVAVEVGDVRDGIIDAAKKWRADLIVVASHGEKGIRRFLLGSVAESVARHAHCSVQIVRRPTGA